MAIAAAGIFTDLTLAAVATLAWLWSRSGFVSTFLLNVMFVCGVGTIALNGNPLLRYDGYYILFLNKMRAHLFRKTDFTLGDPETFTEFIEGKTGMKMKYHHRRKIITF